MPIIDYLAKGVMQTLSKDDFRRIMNDTLDHMLRVMSRRERMEFINDIVNNAVARMLTGLSTEEKAALLREMLPGVLSQFPNLAEELDRRRTSGDASANAEPGASAAPPTPAPAATRRDEA